MNVVVSPVESFEWRTMQGRPLSSNRPSNLFQELRGNTRLEEKTCKLPRLSIKWGYC